MSRNLSCVVLTALLMALGGSRAEAQATGGETPGLEFRIVADRTSDAAIVEASRSPEAIANPPSGYQWVRVAESAGLSKLESALFREVPAKGEKPAHRLILLKLDRQNLTGSDVRRFRIVKTEPGASSIEALLNPSGARRLAVLLRENAPPPTVAASPLRVATVLDGSVISAPVVAGDGRKSIRIESARSDELAAMIDRLNNIAPDSKSRAEALRSFEDARFGLSIRWGLDPASGDDLKSRLSKFKGESFDADAWVALAKGSGAKFLVVPVRSNDGFSLFETRFSTANAREAPFAKDPLKLLLESARKAAIPVVLSYSSENLSMLNDPKPAEQIFREQVRELCAGYGDISGIILEGQPTMASQAVEVVRDTQPGALVIGSVGLDEDVLSAPFDLTRVDSQSPGSAMLMRLEIDGKASITTAILVQSAVEAAGRGINLALEIQAAPDGSIPKPVADRLAEVGRWFSTFGESIHGTRPGPISPTAWGVSTRKGDLVYVHVLRPDRKLAFAPISNPEIRSARLFGDRKADGFGFGTSRAMIETGGIASAVSESYLLLPDAARLPIDTIVVLNPPQPTKKPDEPKPKEAIKK